MRTRALPLLPSPPAVFRRAGREPGALLAIAAGLLLGVLASGGGLPAIALVLGGAVIFALMERPEWCLGLLVFCIPVAVDFGGGLTVTRVVVPLVLGMICINAALRRSPWPRVDTPMAWMGVTFFVIAVASFLWATDPISIPQEIGAVAGYFALLIATLTFIRKPKDIDAPLNMLIVAGIFEAIITIAQVKFRFVLPGDWRPAAQNAIDMTAGGFRAEGTTAHPIFLAGFLQFVMPIIVYRLRTSRQTLLRLVLVAGLVLCAYAWYSAYARSSLIGMVAMLIAAVAVSSRAGAWTALGSLSVGILVLALHGFSVVAVIRSVESIGFLGDAFRHADLYDSVSSFRFRIESWVGGFNLFMQYPWGGAGLGQALHQYMNFLPAWATSPVHPTEIHNVFLEAASELGVLGLFALVGMWVLGFRGVVLAWRDPELGRLARMLFVVLIGQLFFLAFTPMVRDIWFSLPLASVLGTIVMQRRTASRAVKA